MRQCGTTDTQAGFATDAFFVDRDGSLVLYIFQKGARTAGDHERRFVLFKFLGDGFSYVFDIKRIDNSDTVYAECVCKRFKVDGYGRVALYRESVCRVVLVTGHAGYGVVKDDNGRNTLVVGDRKSVGRERVC